MNDQHITIGQLKKQLHDFNHRRDWGKYHSPRNLAMALSVEANELLALYLWCSDQGPQPAVVARHSQVEQEVADVLICLLNFCQRTGIDLSSVVQKKIRQNELKYPADKVRGRLEKYDEYD